jgi:hypothetical protein
MPYRSKAKAAVDRVPDTPQFLKRKAAAQARKCAAQVRKDSGHCLFVELAPRESGGSTAEIELMEAMQAYKQSSGRMFPTWSEVLEVLHGLGYQKA